MRCSTGDKTYVTVPKCVVDDFNHKLLWFNRPPKPSKLCLENFPTILGAVINLFYSCLFNRSLLKKNRFVESKETKIEGSWTMTETKETPKPAEDSGVEARAEQPEISKDARNMAMLCHLLGMVGFFAPLVIWLNEKDKHKFVNEHGQAAMNYQISIVIYYLASWILCFIIVGFFMLIALVIMHIIFVIMGAVKASKGKPWRYPIAIRFIK